MFKTSLMLIVGSMFGTVAAQAAPVLVGYFELHERVDVPYSAFHLALRTNSFPDYIVQSALTITYASVEAFFDGGSTVLNFDACSAAPYCLANQPVNYTSAYISNTVSITRAVLSYTVQGPAVWDTFLGQFTPVSTTFEAVMELEPSHARIMGNLHPTVTLEVGDTTIHTGIPEPSTILLSGAAALALLAWRNRITV